MGDNSWKTQDKFISPDTYKLFLNKVQLYCNKNNISEIEIMLHGGEPLLFGLQRFNLLMEEIRKTENSELIINVGIQSNGYLINEDWINTLNHFNVKIGISYDGLPYHNDLYRVLNNGCGTSEMVEKNLTLLRDQECFSGILCVIDPSSDPIETYNHLISFNPPLIDFLLPHGHWDNKPIGKETESNCIYGEWLIKIFHEWFYSHSSICIRTFEEIIEHLLGGLGTLETLGTEPVTLLTISTSGDFEAVDTMKSVFPGAHKLNLNLEFNDFNEVFNKSQVLERTMGISALSEKCKNCELLKTCGGGYYPHRYSNSNKFKNPSVYCDDLFKLITTIKTALEKENVLCN